MQFRHHLAQQRPVGGVDGARDLLDKLVTELPLFIPHRETVEHGALRRLRLGWATSIFSAMPRLAGLTDRGNSSELRCTHYPIGNTQRNAKYVQLQMTRNFSEALCAAVAASMTFVAAAAAAECPRKDALGTSRVLAVDAATTPRVGLKSFPQTLPLEDHEVVLTFDDGPWPATDRKILAALAQECVRATFFLIGKPASEHPELVRRMAAEGHTVAHHTWTHHNLKYMKPEAAIGEIDKGIAAVETALHGTATTTPEHAVLSLSLL